MVGAAGNSVHTRKVVLCGGGHQLYTRRMNGYAKQRARDKIVWLAGQGLDLVTFWRESTEALAKAVPYYMTPCWFTLDPVSLLVTSHCGYGELPPEWLAHEYYEDDFHRLAD